MLFRVVRADDLKHFCMSSQLARPVPKQLLGGGDAVKLNCLSFAVAFETLLFPSFVVEPCAVVSICSCQHFLFLSKKVLEKWVSSTFC